MPAPLLSRADIGLTHGDFSRPPPAPPPDLPPDIEWWHGAVWSLFTGLRMKLPAIPSTTYRAEFLCTVLEALKAPISNGEKHTGSSFVWACTYVCARLLSYLTFFGYTLQR